MTRHGYFTVTATNTEYQLTGNRTRCIFTSPEDARIHRKNVPIMCAKRVFCEIRVGRFVEIIGEVHFTFSELYIYMCVCTPPTLIPSSFIHYIIVIQSTHLHYLFVIKDLRWFSPTTSALHAPYTPTRGYPQAASCATNRTNCLIY